MSPRLGALLVAALLLVVWIATNVAPPSSDTGATRGADDGAPGADDNAPALTVAPRPTADAPPAAPPPAPDAGCVLTVTLEMPDGTPLPGFGVRVRALTADGPVKRALAEDVSDADGRVRFEGLTAGALNVEAGFVENVVAEEVVCSPGAPAQVVLRSVPTGVLVTGHVTRAGRPVAGRLVVVRGRDHAGVAVWGRMTTDEDGRYRGVIRAGDYRLLVAGGPCDAMGGRGNIVFYAPGGTGPWLEQGPLVLTGQEGHVERHLVVPPTRLVCTVRRSGLASPLAGARIFVQVAGVGNEDRATRATDADGRVVFEDLPYGTLVVEATHAGSAASASREVVLAEAAPVAHVEIDLEAAARVVLEVRGTDGKRLALDRVGRPEIRHVASGRRFEGEEPPSRTFGPVRELIYAVPAGRIVVALEDRVEDDAIVFGALGPPQETTRDVAAGETLRVVLHDVVRRASVMLHVEQPDGAPDPDGRVEVRDADGRRVGQTRWHVPGSAVPKHWLGFLAPGRYRVLLSSGDAVWEESIEVTGENLSRQFARR